MYVQPCFVLDLGGGPRIPYPAPSSIKRAAESLVVPGKPVPNYDFFILNNESDYIPPDAPCYMQARPQREPKYEGMFRVEVRDGFAGRHYVGYVEAGEQLQELFASYLRSDDLWRELIVWRDISHRYEDLKPNLPKEESAASFFPEGEWEQGLEDKKRRDDEFWQAFDGPTPPPVDT